MTEASCSVGAKTSNVSDRLCVRRKDTFDGVINDIAPYGPLKGGIYGSGASVQCCWTTFHRIKSVRDAEVAIVGRIEEKITY